jgi:hypothetical protein
MIKFLISFLILFCSIIAFSEALMAQEKEAKKVVPAYIQSNTHPKLNPALNDSSEVPQGYKLITLEANSKLFEDATAYVINIVERPEVLQVKFSQWKTWVIIEDKLEYKDWLEELKTLSVPSLEMTDLPLSLPKSAEE